MKFSLMFALLFMMFAGAAHSQDSAGLFFHGTAPTLDDITRVAGGATVNSEQVEAVTRVTVASSASVNGSPPSTPASLVSEAS